MLYGCQVYRLRLEAGQDIGDALECDFRCAMLYEDKRLTFRIDARSVKRMT